MEQEKSKSLSFPIYIALISLIFIRPFFSGLAYPLFELHYEIIAIFLAITIICRGGLNLPCRYIIPIALLISAYIISTIISINTQNSIKETIRLISCLSIFFLVSKTDNNQKKNIRKSIIIAASVISLYAIYQYFWGYQYTIEYLKKIGPVSQLSDGTSYSPYTKDILIGKRAIGTFPSPNIFAGYLLMILFLPLPNIQLRKLQEAACAVVIVIALILTKSLGAWLSIMTVLVISFFLFYKNIKKLKAIAMICLIFIIFVTIFIILSKQGRLINSNNPHNSVTQRLNYWRISISAIKDHPLLGIGPGNFQEVFLRYKTGWCVNTRYAHNIFLQTWLETGILGLFAMCLLIASILNRAFLKSRYVFLAGMAFILQNLIDITYFIPETGLFFWIIIGLSI